MKLCILGDTHFGMRGDSLEFHNYYRKFYENIFFPYLKENNITFIFQLGDLFDRRKFINFNSLYLCRKYFFDKCKEEGITLHTLLGNHDVSYKNTLEVNSSTLLLNDYDNVTVWDKVATLPFDGIPIDIVPWICDDNEKEVLNFIENSKSQICFGHFEIDGFEMDRGNIAHGVQNTYKMFHKINYDDGETDFEHWKAVDYDQYKDCMVKVVVLNKQNPFLFDYVIDNLYKSGISDIGIVEDFSDTNSIEDQDIVDQAEDTMTILSKYIDGLELNVESNKLKSIMKEVYIEALNTETTE